MIGYQTHQRNQLISFFEAHPNETFTIDEITEKLRDQLGQDAPSRSTVYRTVADLEKEKLLQRMYLADRRRSAYQYRDQHACASHLHIRCEKCHALVHLDADVSDEIEKLLRQNASVSLDVGNTVLMGRCEKCSRQA